MTYAQGVTLAESSSLLIQVKIAVIVAADVIRQEVGTTTNHTARLAWAKGACADPDGTAKKMIWAVIAQNIGLTLAQAQAATDSAVQTAVQAAVDLMS